jgi:transcriptional regulator with XRE-family HTH domain
MTTMPCISVKLESIRKQMAMTIEQFSELLNVEPRSYQRYKKGDNIDTVIFARMISSLKEHGEALLDDLYDASRQLWSMYHFFLLTIDLKEDLICIKAL